MSPLLVRPADLAAEADAVGDLMVEYMTWATKQFRATFGLDAPTDPAQMRDGLDDYAKPSSALLVAVTADGDLAGAGALRTLEPGIVELKRMYVRPAWRGRHVGSRLLDGLLDQAAELGASTIRLDTARFMQDAHGLYRSRGFVERDHYQGTEIPPDFQQYWAFFERSVTGA
ncbi:GNAT family N-acetyltransferase [Amycolatopsis sp. NBC_01480]|uniref:GNAT family N-acetyltransferase n=1 Tax=Amycolatopsis sp. NBC_01480 TaxID=2903562 RepID=UPI002E2AAFD8|nr:GNAT family N-acetyltransferase [Amycolatopsis sp. NBC_01480]